jgi:hypothetical protein
MSFFQIAILVVVPCLALGTVLAMLKGWVTRRECLAWTFICLVGCAAAAWPEVTSQVANAVGIGRGADLVSYCAVVVMLVGFWMVYLRLRTIRRQLTLLVRHLATLEAEGPLDVVESQERRSPHVDGSEKAG